MCPGAAGRWRAGPSGVGVGPQLLKVLTEQADNHDLALLSTRVDGCRRLVTGQAASEALMPLMFLGRCDL